MIYWNKDILGETWEPLTVAVGAFLIIFASCQPALVYKGETRHKRLLLVLPGLIGLIYLENVQNFFDLSASTKVTFGLNGKVVVNGFIFGKITGIITGFVAVWQL